MPKKRKARRPNIPLHTGPVPYEGPAAAPAGEAAGPTRAAAPQRASATAGQAIKADYTHVVSDLKRIAVLGGGLIALLIGLSFFIR